MLLIAIRDGNEDKFLTISAQLLAQFQTMPSIWGI